MPPTLRDVAAAAGVSIRTVSNVVNGYAAVSEELRVRVQAALDELGYRPNLLARSLKQGRSNLVALVLPELDNPYFAELTRAMVEEGTRRGFTVMIDQTNGDPERERDLVLRADRTALFDGLIVSPLGLSDEQFHEIPTSHAVVFLGEDDHPKFDHVRIDNSAAAQAATAHLIGQGCRRVAALGVHPTVSHSTAVTRLDGYRAALAEAGMPFDPDLVIPADRFTRDEGAAAMHAAWKLDDPPDGLFCFSDLLALGALRTAHELGIAVPGQLAIIGFDDIDDGRFSTPTLSTISPDKRWIATAALDSLTQRIAGEATEPSTIIAPWELLVRESSQRPGT
ncbi:LacI family DNA-binding transcriptional regulator [Phytoactinopolyspora endophytica]|uniref:LacI family DNA-binding transcriptional regulator n=1 Tax=Phytoactinopolyspora endophytica TaxID=1642495 RepID=UPI00101D661F|nr:LacI family DNA-binding transcriptional regulator [Phytoactinopolyspora endophytica]